VFDQVETRRMSGVIFDLDGTLVDSAPDIHAAANAALSDEGVPGLTLAEARDCVGHGAAVFVSRAMALRGLGEDPARHRRILDGFLGRYEAAVHLTQPYPGVPEALEALRAAGHALAICTNKPTAPARAVLSHLGLLGHFGPLVGGDSLPVRKPDPAPLAAAVAALGGGPALFVGDSEVDAETAQAARLPFALFTEGYRKTPVEALAHDARFAAFAELPPLVARLVPAPG
jgi:phosphoglycolate phosphatase